MNPKQQAKDMLIGGSNALRHVARQVEQRPDTSTWMHKDEVAEMLHGAADVLDKAVPR